MSYQSINPFNSELVKSFGEQTDQQLENGGDMFISRIPNSPFLSLRMEITAPH